MGGGNPVVRRGFFEQRVFGSRLDVELDNEVRYEHECHVQEEVRGQDEEERGGVVLGVVFGGGGAE